MEVRMVGLASTNSCTGLEIGPVPGQGWGQGGAGSVRRRRMLAGTCVDGFLQTSRLDNLQPATAPQDLVCHGLAKEPFSSLWLFSISQIEPGGR